MTNQIFLFICTAHFVITPDASAETKTYRCVRASSEIKIDGKLDEGAWKAAEVINNWAYPWYSDGPKQGAKAWLVWDDTYLYMAAWVEDTELLGSITTTDEHKVWLDERFEFYLDPNPKDAVYRCWEFTTMKHKLDYGASWGRKFAFDWDSKGLEYVVVLDGTLNDQQPDKGYWVEARIPFKGNFEKPIGFKARGQRNNPEAPVSFPTFKPPKNIPPKPGDIWHLGINREDQFMKDGKKKYVLMMWADPKVEKPDFHVPSAFGRMVFTK
jgi:hypothetical protein